MNGSASVATAQAVDSEWCRDCWYPAGRSDRIQGKKLQTAMLLGVPLVLGRDRAGRVFALRDSCPHRGMPFSYGRFDGELLECCYHGWKFEGRTGECREIPSLTSDTKLKVDRIRAEHFPCEEYDGYAWVYMPDPASKPASKGGEPPPAPRLPVFGDKYRIAHLVAYLPCSVDHGIIGLMDPAHGPFVHQSWWWRGKRSIHEKQKIFEAIPNGFRIRAHAPSANSAPYKLLGVYGKPITTKIEFELPNQRREETRCGDYWFSSRATVTPETHDRCRIDFCAAWNIFRHVPLITTAFRIFGRTFLDQDVQTMVKQADGLKHNPSLMLIDDADRPAKWYFQLKKAYVEATRNGTTMTHPITEPATLRWRS